MPTIIRPKPERPKVPKVLEKKYEMNALADVFSRAPAMESEAFDEGDDEWDSESPPMPTCPPPALPPDILAGLLKDTPQHVSQIL